MVASRVVNMLAPFLSVYFLLLLSHSGAQSCPVEFENMCECGLVPYGPDKKLTYVTNCTNSGFENAAMLKELPEETEVLIFVGNEIKDLPLNIFRLDAEYDKLHTIDLSNNHIQTIKGRTFHNVANVTKLILNDNDLYIVSKDHHPRMFSNFVTLKELHLRNAFTEKVKSGDYLNNLAEIFENSSLTHLRVLNMENNEISAISHGEFCSLPALEELYLSDNHLTDIPLDFSCLKHLKELHVGNNFISFLSDQTLKSLDTNSTLILNLTRNPFKCDCKLIKTYEWMITTLMVLIGREELNCFNGFPSTIGKHIFAISLDELKCSESLKKLEYHSSASYIVLAVGFFCLLIGVSILIYKYKISVRSYLQRIVQPIRRKFNYSSLDRADITMDV